MTALCISSLVVRTRPERLAAVRSAIGAIPVAEVYGEHEDGRLVVVLDTDDSRQAADTISLIQDQPDVLSATLVYQYDDQIGPPTEATV